ncbi:MAG: DUF2914 domain-containing protein [Acidobacteriales bacterium]|nr:DUF2914 domain-containing protein [Terriglobales bacterium]
MKLRYIVLSLAVMLLLVSTTSFAQESEPAKSTEPAASQNGSGIKVMKSVLCLAVKDREPQEEVNSAKVGDVVVGWMQINSAADTTITHRWMRDGETVSDVSLNVKTSPSYRAWSRKTIGGAGSWKWQILDADGNVLKEVAFTVGS